jgi:hypothetical protein
MGKNTLHKALESHIAAGHVPPHRECLKRVRRVSRTTWLFLLAMFLSARVASAAPKDPEALFGSVIAGVQRASGHAALYFTGGQWRLTARTSAGQDIVFFRVNDPTTSEIQFSYVNGTLQSAQISFSPPVHVELVDRVHPIGAYIKSVTYASLGNVVTWDAQYDGTATNLGLAPRLQSAFELTTDPQLP